MTRLTVCLYRLRPCRGGHTTLRRRRIIIIIVNICTYINIWINRTIYPMHRHVRSRIIMSVRLPFFFFFFYDPKKGLGRRRNAFKIAAREGGTRASCLVVNDDLCAHTVRESPAAAP